MHHFLLDVNSSMQIVSIDLVSKYSCHLTSSSLLIKTIFPPSFLFFSLLKGGHFYHKLSPWKSFISLSFCQTLIVALCNISFRLKILVLKKFMFRWPIIGFFSYVLLVFMGLSMS